MAKNNTKLDLPEIEAAPAANSDAPKAKKTAAKKSTAKKRKSVGKFFRDVISELKKVEWASFKNTAEYLSKQAQCSWLFYSFWW